MNKCFILQKSKQGAFIFFNILSDDNLMMNRFVLDICLRPQYKNNVSVYDFEKSIRNAKKIKITIE